MTAAGLVGVPDPSELFGRTDSGRGRSRRRRARSRARGRSCSRSRRSSRAPISRCRAGSRPGVDPKRLAMIVAVLARHAGVALGAADVFVNVAGGVRIDEPGADLAVALAIASAARGAAGPGRHRRVRRDRAHRSAAARRAGGAAARGVREARRRDGRRARTARRVAAARACAAPRRSRQAIAAGLEAASRETAAKVADERRDVRDAPRRDASRTHGMRRRRSTRSFRSNGESQPADSLAGSLSSAGGF